MGQFSFISEPPAAPGSPIDLDGFASFYALLRALVAGQGEETFYERLRILLCLARWPSNPPTVMDLSRVLGQEVKPLAATLSTLRTGGWLLGGTDDHHYKLAPQGRILITILQLLAQPWTEAEAAPVATQIYAAAEYLGVKADLLRAHFEAVLSTLEERTAQINMALEAEDTILVKSRLSESLRNTQLGQQVLGLRHKGAVSPDEHQQVQRMHAVLSDLSHVSANLEIRYQALLTRDLLAEGGVTLGDIMDWAREATTEEMAETIGAFTRSPYLPLWSLPEMAFSDGQEALLGHVVQHRRLQLPKPEPLGEIPPTASISSIKQRIYSLQETLRHRLQDQDPLSLSAWVQHPEWSEAVLHFIAVLDPELQQLSPPIFLYLDAGGQVDVLAEGAVQAITVGAISHQSASPQRDEV